MKKITNAFVLATILCLLAVTTSLAQDEELSLRLSRDFGFSSGTGDIQGTFSMRASGPDDLERVEFYIDETMIFEDVEGPFRVQFTTDSYPAGVHSMVAIGYLTDGSELHSRVVQVNFVSADEGWQSAMRMIGPVLGIVVVAILLSVVGPMLIKRGKTEYLPLGTERNYGLRGGTICPRCRRPFAMHLYGLNLITHRYDRCPYCGKWSVVRGRSLADLRAAERGEREAGLAEKPQSSQEDKLRRELDDSKYQDLY
ncbi:MAG: hypothetical protein JXB85_12430 [Anaerolineales bacterium]|nr:hypothetical protein [Anaerolineales bacterium]